MSFLSNTNPNPFPDFIDFDMEGVDSSVFQANQLFKAPPMYGFAPLMPARHRPYHCAPALSSLYCTICCSDTDELVGHGPCALACGHVFGFSCVKKWFARAPHPICPVCYKPTDPDAMRMIFATTMDHAKLFDSAKKEAKWEKKEAAYKATISYLMEQNKMVLDSVNTFIDSMAHSAYSA